jgi:hypothetical protein
MFGKWYIYEFVYHSKVVDRTSDEALVANLQRCDLTRAEECVPFAFPAFK